MNEKNVKIIFEAIHESEQASTKALMVKYINNAKTINIMVNKEISPTISSNSRSFS